ncbi:hypothetical protein P8452_30879 [Trifolium repens]|nr:hypothetical protein P8452_30879 [Trifolium repens]
MQNKRYMAKIFMFVFVYASIVSLSIAVNTYMQTKLPCKSDADCPRARGRYIWQCCDGFCRSFHLSYWV